MRKERPEDLIQDVLALRQRGDIDNFEELVNRQLANAQLALETGEGEPARRAMEVAERNLIAARAVRQMECSHLS